jgi:hypothetical protein
VLSIRLVTLLVMVLTLELLDVLLALLVAIAPKLLVVVDTSSSQAYSA